MTVICGPLRYMWVDHGGYVWTMAIIRTGVGSRDAYTSKKEGVAETEKTHSGWRSSRAAMTAVL